MTKVLRALEAPFGFITPFSLSPSACHILTWHNFLTRSCKNILELSV